MSNQFYENCVILFSHLHQDDWFIKRAYIHILERLESKQHPPTKAIKSLKTLKSLMKSRWGIDSADFDKYIQRC